MLDSILPIELNEAIQKLNFNKINEIRLRVGQPIVIDYCGVYFLCRKGITDKKIEAIICTKNMIEQIISKVTENSLYAFNEQLKQGFLTAYGGIRIGVCGECVYENNVLKTIKSISSLNIRIPHEVKNCSLKILNYVASNDIKNTLILSPPGAGKTTMLRDLALQLSDRFCKNILVIDERNEIANCVAGVCQHNIGHFTDIITNSNKIYGLESGIRSMKPDIVMTDEIANVNDINAISYALGCGVKVIATTHCASFEELQLKQDFSQLIKNKLFDLYVVLSTKHGPGTVEAIYAKDYSCIYI